MAVTRVIISTVNDPWRVLFIILTFVSSFTVHLLATECKKQKETHVSSRYKNFAFHIDYGPPGWFPSKPVAGNPSEKSRHLWGPVIRAHCNDKFDIQTNWGVVIDLRLLRQLWLSTTEFKNYIDPSYNSIISIMICTPATYVSSGKFR